MSATSAAARVFGIPELLERILLEAPMKEAFLAQRVCRDFRNTTVGSKKLQRRFFLLPCDETPEEVLYGDDEVDVATVDAFSDGYSRNDGEDDSEDDSEDGSEDGSEYDSEDDSEDDEEQQFVWNPLLARDYPWFIAKPAKMLSEAVDSFANHLMLDSRDVGRPSVLDRNCVRFSCDCERKHSIPVLSWEEDLAWPGDPTIFVTRNEHHSWRKMVLFQPSNCSVDVLLDCRGDLVCERNFTAGKTVGEMVDWMEVCFREHQRTGKKYQR